MTGDAGGGGAAERAFEDLRAEVSVLRRALEALPAHLRDNRPPDYSVDLARIVHGLGTVADRVQALGQHPAVRMTPEQHGQAIAREGGRLVREAVTALEEAKRDLVGEREQLSGVIGVVRERRRQRAWLWSVGVGALVLGLVGSPLVARVLPWGLDGQVAALIMGRDRWQAGAVLMRSDSPEGWHGLVDASRLVNANQGVLAACRETAAKVRKEQRCTITVPVP
ncbi:hypothetical protein FBZ89_1432 [Nitrospirillum amazonense]|uniref:Uncharacterized protein n=1 Tax=Nitrospirillum amazonense TaxID=28077 RepID=A0A560EIW5_9PROT|nr:DUF6118 family protein [Nitrospirillum amazonense]TWB09304.1 hypothetical protein FBZ89_1432 [Nitrospirillum amazonense]